MNIRHKELFIFDCDGTLVDSERLTNKIIAEMLTDIDIPTSTIQSMDLFAGKKFKDIIAHIQENRPDYDHSNFEIDFRQRSAKAFETDLQPIEGVKNVLRRIEGLKVVASNGPRVKMDITLQVTGMFDYFNKEDVFSAYDIQKWKPDPTLFLNILDHYNTEATKALVIEDTISGVLGAINAGIDVVAINPNDDKSILDLDIPSFKTMAEIEAFLFS